MCVITVKRYTILCTNQRSLAEQLAAHMRKFTVNQKHRIVSTRVHEQMTPQYIKHQKTRFLRVSDLSVELKPCFLR